MRNDIPSETLEKANSKVQTIHENSNPKLSLVVSRKQTMLEDESLIEKKRIARATVGAMTDCGIAVCHPRHSVEDSAIWVCYVRSGKLYARYNEKVYDLSSVNWKQLDIGDVSADKCDIGFEATLNGTEYITGKRPFILYLKSGAVHYLSYDEEEDEYADATLVASGVSSISAGRGADNSLALYYVSSGTIYFKTYKNSTWSSAYTVTQTLSGVTQVSAFDIDNQYAVGLTAYAGGKTYWIIGSYTPSGDSYSWSTWMEIADSDSVGTVVQYHDSKFEAIYNHGTLCYKEYDGQGSYGEEEELYNRTYYAMRSSNLNKGTLYMALLIEKGEYSIVYLFRYVYMKDISSFTHNASYTMQVDNAITQTNVEVKNINDSMYTTEATLFAPTSKLVLGVSYGDSDVVPMTVAYIDEAEHVAGVNGTSVNISGRNVTGAYLHDLTFDDSFELVGTPSEVVAQIMEYFGIEDYEVDTSADEDEQSVAQVYTIVAEPDKTPLKALEELANMISEDAALGKTWGNEERYDGKLIIGFDDFRNSFIPKSFYTFNDNSDVFAKSVQRCIDGVYSQVRCTGVTPDGKEIAVTYPVTTFRYWSVGEHKTYHADKVEGITKKNLKKYAKALAKQLKKTGQTFTYSSILRPQLVIGDAAQILASEDDDEPECIGIMTEITHSFGQNGCKTSFTINSGGNIQANGALAYTANTKLKGKNRKDRITDYIPNSKTYSYGSDFQTYSQDEDFVETIRNIGFRLLDEPTNVDAEYDTSANAIKIKWTDPSDISETEPKACEWAGTVVVRSETGAPKHRWDGTLVTDSTTRNAYSQTALVDNSNIVKGNIYYYGIFPYHIAIDDSGLPEKHYRYTKVFSIRAGSDLAQPVIKDVVVNGVDVTVQYMIPALTSGSYSYIKLAMKKGAVPTSLDIADRVYDISASSTEKQINGLDPKSRYYFVIFASDGVTEVASDPEDCLTGVDSGYIFNYTGEIQEFTAPKTGIYSLETWGAQGGNATDGTLVARGGYGAYAVGEVLLQQGDKLYIGVGGQNGYNGGGGTT